MKPTKLPTDDDLPQGAPPEGVRAVVSFLLFLHFFALAVAIASNVSPSSLEVRLRDVPGVRPYIQQLALDSPYQFHLTYFEAADFDHFIEAELEFANGDVQQLEFPAAGDWPGQRYRRWERLAAQVARRAENSEASDLLPQVIAAHLIARSGAVGGRIRSPRPDIARMAREGPFVAPRLAEGASHRQAYYRGGYDARIVMLGERVQLFKPEPAGESAPAAVTEAVSE